MSGLIVSNVVNAQFTPVISYATGTTYKAAIATDSSNANMSFNGGIDTNDETVTVPTFTNLHLGTINYSNSNFSKYLRKAIVLPRRMTNAELQTLTT